MRQAYCIELVRRVAVRGDRLMNEVDFDHVASSEALRVLGVNAFCDSAPAAPAA